ncbi:MAG: YHYH domain-containing protein [Candidatus Thiodiazotropha sp.]
MKFIIIVFALFFVSSISAVTPNIFQDSSQTQISRSGGTDKYGCHYNKKTGKYHCHKRKKRGGDCPE